MAPAYGGPLGRFLEALGTYCDVTWKYLDGRLKIQIYETETYRLYAVPSVATIKASMLSSGTAPTSNSAAGSTGSESWPGLFGQESTLDKWILCRLSSHSVDFSASCREGVARPE